MFFKPKTAKKEYTAAMLPHTRKEIFYDVIKLHYLQLLQCGLLLLAFSLPLLLSTIAEDLYQEQLAQELLTGVISAEEAASSAVAFSNTRTLLDIPLLMLLGVGLGGLARIIRQYAWEENVFLRYDFLKGVRQNSGQTAQLMFFVGLACLTAQYVRNLSSLIVEGSIYTYLGRIPSVAFLLILAPPAAYALVSIAVYSNRFSQNLRIGFLLYGRNIPQTLLACLPCMAIFAPQLIPNFYCHIIGGFLACLLTPFIMLGWFLFVFDKLDTYINPDLAPKLIGRGIVLAEKQIDED